MRQMENYGNKGDNMETQNEEIDVIKNQTITKNVLFYKISTEDPSILVTDERLKIIKEKFNYDRVKYKNKLGNSTEFIIEEIKKESDYFFGSICKIDDSIDPFTQLKLANNNIMIENNDIIFNHYTYFYLDYESLYISCIVSKNIQSPDKYISNFLNYGNLGFFKIVPLSKGLEEMNQYVNSFKLRFANNVDFAPINELQKLGCEIKDFKVEVKLKNKKDCLLENIKKLVSNNKKHLKIASIGNDEEDYDLIKGIFSKKAKIRIPSNFKDKIETILLLLREQLVNAK